MGFRRYAALTILSAARAEDTSAFSRTAHRADFEHVARRPGFVYVRSRAISSRANDNHDEFPPEELEASWRTFIGKPVFVNHANEDLTRARGVIVAAALHRDSHEDGSPDTWIEVLQEVDAVRFPMLAQAVLAGEIDRTSMGVDVGVSECSYCGNRATTAAQFCQHVRTAKGRTLLRTGSDGGQERVRVTELCRDLTFFENSLLVEPPADPTAAVLGVDSLEATGASKRNDYLPEVGDLDNASDSWLQELIAQYQSKVHSATSDGDRRRAESYLYTLQEELKARHPAWWQRLLGTEPRRQHFMEMPRWEVPRFASNQTDGFSGRTVWSSAGNEGVTHTYTLTWPETSLPTPGKLPHLAAKDDDEDEEERKRRKRKQDKQTEDAAESEDPEAPGEETEDEDEDEPDKLNELEEESNRPTSPDKEQTAPGPVDTLTEDECPVCGAGYGGDAQACPSCGYARPPEEFREPDTDAAAKARGDAPPSDDEEERDPTSEDDSEQDKGGDEEDPNPDEDDDKNPFAKKKESSMRDALERLAAQQVEQRFLRLEQASQEHGEILQAIAEAVGLKAEGAGIDEGGNSVEPIPGQGQPAKESPVDTTDGAQTPDATDNPEAEGGTSGATEQVTPDATDSPENEGGSIADTEFVSGGGVEVEVSGSEDPVHDVPTVVRDSDPISDPPGMTEPAAEDARPNKVKVSGSRPIAALRLARLRLATGTADGEEFEVQAGIEGGDLSDEAIASEIDTLDRVVQASRKREAAAQKAREAARLSPPRRDAADPVPSLVGERTASLGLSSDDTALFG